MHNSIYTALIGYEDVGGDMIERINHMGLAEVFGPIAEEWGADQSVFNKVLFYTLHCYSRESPFVIHESDWSNIKRKVAKKVGIDHKEDLFFQLYDLRNKNYTFTIRRYLDYQGSKATKHLMMLKDLYEQMVNSAIENITDKDGVIMYDQKVKNAEYADRLYEKINLWQQRIEGEETHLNKARGQLREVEIKRNNLTLRMEDNLGE